MDVRNEPGEFNEAEVAEHGPKDRAEVPQTRYYRVAAMGCPKPRLRPYECALKSFVVLLRRLRTCI